MKRLSLILVLAVLFSVLAAVPAGAQTAQPATTQSASTQSSFVYVVVRGDTLAKIAIRYHTTIWALLRANPAIRNPNLIYVGQRLVIPVANPGSTTVKVALIAPNSGGNVGCGDSTVLVTRQVPATNQVLTAAIRELLSIKTHDYGQSGLIDALYASTLQIQSVTIDSAGKATIRLTGQMSLGGECDDPRVIAQFEQTAKQFPTVKSVEVYVNGTLLQTLLSGKGQ